MQPTTRVSKVPKSDLDAFMMMLNRIAETPGRTTGQKIVRQTGISLPTFGDLQVLVRNESVFRRVLKDAGIIFSEGHFYRMYLSFRRFGPNIPMCGVCGDLPIEAVGEIASVRQIDQTCLTCGFPLKYPSAKKPSYRAWTTGEMVSATVTVDENTSRGSVPISEMAVRRELPMNLAIEEMLRNEGVLATEFLLWLFHGPKKDYCGGCVGKAMGVIEQPWSLTGGAAQMISPMVLDWVRQAKTFKKME